MKLIIFVIIALFPVFSQRQDVKSSKQLENLIDVTLSEGTLRIYPLTDNTVRIKFFKNVETRVPELIFTSSISTPKFQVTDTDSKLEIKVKNIIVELKKQTGKLSFADNAEKIFLSEKAS